MLGARAPRRGLLHPGGGRQTFVGWLCVSFWCSRTFFFLLWLLKSESYSERCSSIQCHTGVFQVFLLYFYFFLCFFYTCKSFPILGIHHVSNGEVWMQCSFLNEEIIVPSHLFFPIPFEMPSLSYILCSNIDINLFLNIRNRIFCLFHWSVNVPVSHSLNYLYLCH